ncbi:MAG: hypothetical protein H0X37_18220 [Herpetosiphonaceae bacterium]|nr:hypothetical protein [Herpetosiphonaceae bacterium]
MADFLSRLAARTLGLVPVVQPAIAPLFAPQQSMGSDYLAYDQGDGLVLPEEHRVLSTDPPRTAGPQDMTQPQRMRRRSAPPTTHQHEPDELGADGQGSLPTTVPVSHLTDVPVAVEAELDRDPQIVRADGAHEHRTMTPDEMTMEVPPQRVALRQHVMRTRSVLPAQTSSSTTESVETRMVPLQSTIEHRREEPFSTSSGRSQSSLANEGSETDHHVVFPIQARQLVAMTQTGISPDPLLAVREEAMGFQSQGDVPIVGQQRGGMPGARAQQMAGRQHQNQSAPPAPTINVSIGRIEVRATPPPPQDRKPRSAPQTMSLQEYLHERDDRGRR